MGIRLARQWQGKTRLRSGLVRNGPPLAYETTANLKQDFSDSDIPYAVDIVEWTSCSEQFRELIAQNKFQLTL